MPILSRTSVASFVVVVASAVANVAACGGGGSPHGGFGDGGGGGGSGGHGQQDATTHDSPHLDFDTSHGALTSLSITPPTATITVTNPAKPPTTQLKAVAKYMDGSTATVSASWTVNRVDIAGVGAGTGLIT